jgi:hypothetical protein
VSGPDSNDHGSKQQRKALMKPFEVVIIAAAAGIFVLLIVLLTVKDIVLGLIFAGVAMVIVLVVMALLLLNYKPNAEAPVYLDRQLAESDDPGAKGAALRPFDGDAEAEAAAEADDPEPGEPDEK